MAFELFQKLHAYGIISPSTERLTTFNHTLTADSTIFQLLIKYEFNLKYDTKFIHIICFFRYAIVRVNVPQIVVRTISFSSFESFAVFQFDFWRYHLISLIYVTIAYKFVFASKSCNRNILDSDKPNVYLRT